MTRFGFVRAAITRPPSFWHGLGITLGTVAAATGLRWLLGSAADPVPFVTYFPAIVLCALLAGWRFGIASIVLSAVIVNRAFLDEPYRWTTDLQTIGMIALFSLSSLLLVAIAQTLRRTFREVVAANERATLLSREMRHRVRNTLSIVQALSQQTARSDPANFQSAFSKRLAALADAHDVLLLGSGETCDLAAIVGKTCSVFHHDSNFVFEGPHCELPADSCVPLSLALHELCTNAVKHGALSVPTGRVHVTWNAPVDGSTTLIWEESGGPEVRPPAKKGLGTALLTSQGEIGKADLQFHPRGLRCELILRAKDSDQPLGAPAAA
jgi:two-component sensor histidine kinase